MIDVKKLVEKYKEIIRYLIVGGLTTVVSLGSYYILVITVLDPQSGLQLQIANLLSWVAAVTFAYVANRVFVFKSVRKDWLHEAIAFYSSRIATLLFDVVIMFVMVTLLKYNDKVVKLFVQVVVTIGNYILSKLVFK